MSATDKPATPDILWKELIKKFFRDFVAFYKPDLFPVVKFDKTEFLDKELLSITGKKHKGIVDVLAKIHLKNGTVEHILFHVEIQGYGGADFAARMFGYFVRIWDCCRTPVTALAIITPGFGKGVAPNVFSFDAFGTKLRYEYDLFDTRKLRYDECIRSTNPVEVAAGILAESRGRPLWKRKYEVFRRLTKVGLTNEEIHLLISYVDRLSPLSEDELTQYYSMVAREKKEDVAMIMTSFEERALKRGRQEGIEKGIEKGMERTAERMIVAGMSQSDIRTITGLSLRRIEELRKKPAKK